MCLTAYRAKAGGDRFVFRYSAFSQSANLTRCTQQSPPLGANKLLLLIWSETPVFYIVRTSTVISTFCSPCILVYLSQYLINLMHKICFTISFISRIYMFRAHVLIITNRWPGRPPIGVMIPEAV